MSTLQSGELFAGVGGLGMAVDEVFGSEPAWFSEFDKAPSKVLEHRHPDVPNHGDVTKVDFRAIGHTDIRAGGFPCTDVSLAGRRAGLKDGTRSGLWSEFRRSIEEDRPDWVVIENVRGLYTANAFGDMEPCPWCLGDGDGQHNLRALDAVLADLSRLGFDAEWAGLRASDIGAPHGRFRVFIVAWPSENTRRSGSGGRAEGQESSRRDDATVRSDPGGNGGRTDSGMKLLSTPDTVPEAPNTGSNSHKAGNIVGLGNQVMSLLPTPVVTDSADSARHTTTTGTSHGGTSLTDAMRLLPTPEAKLASSGPDYARMNRDGSGGDDLTMSLWREGMHLLPTPNVAMAEGGQTSRSGDRKGEKLLGGIAADAVTDWGPYASAIERWERVLGRPAPAPVRYDGRGGKPRLNPELTEWMMAWPEGWVTDPEIGLTRAEQLRACGNGVVPAQAAAALRELLARPGVPPIKEAA